MRCLYVKNGIVENVVEQVQITEDVADGCNVFEDLTGATNAGDAVDEPGMLKERKLDRFEVLMFQELLRLTNEARAMQISPLEEITGAQYRTFLKTGL